jgi:hypothetical protein
MMRKAEKQKLHCAVYSRMKDSSESVNVKLVWTHIYIREDVHEEN